MILAVFLATVPTEAWAWGSTGHRITGELAVRDLPSVLPDFIRSEAAALQVGEFAREPDRLRGAGISHDPDLDPGHFIDVSDDQRILGGPPLDPLPATREAYDKALRNVGSDEYRSGFLPYSIIDGWQRLVKDFAYWRADTAGEKFAKNEDERAWFVRDRKAREQLTIRDLGCWAHFVGDGSQPLHVSVHYDGWGNFPNPERYRTAKGIHLYFEGAFVRAYVREADVQAAVAPYRPFGGSVRQRVAAYLLATQAEIVPFYRLEKARAFDRDTAEGRAFAIERLAAAVDELRDMIVDAWAASDDAEVGYPAVMVKDVETGKIDAFGHLRGED